MERQLSLISFLLGVLGTLVTIFEIPSGPLRISSLILFLLLTCGGLLSLLFQEVDLLSALLNLKQLKRLGIHRIYTPSGGNIGTQQMANARNVRIMAVSANALIKNRKSEIVNALRKQRALIRVLLAEPDSQFVSDVEETESPYRVGQISAEIRNVERLLSEYVEEAASGRRVEEIGKVEIGYYTTHLRSSLILCDESWGWLTLNLPPKRAVQSVSLELSQANRGLLKDCIRHFDRCWEIAEQHGRVLKIVPKCSDNAGDNSAPHNQ